MKHFNAILLVLVAAIGSLVYVFNDRNTTVETYSGELLSLKVPQQQKVKNETSLPSEGMETIIQPTPVYTDKPAEKKGVETAAAGFPMVMYQGEEREIGFRPEKGMHHPSEEVFNIFIDNIPADESAVYMTYELYGVADYTQVARSINEQPVFGGYFIKRWDEWTQQSERINPALLHKGLNVIRFTIADDATYRYKIRNLKIDIQPSVNQTQNSLEQGNNHSMEIRNENQTGRSLVVNQPVTAFYYKQYGFLQGYVSGKDADKAKLSIGNRKVRNYQGEFEGIALRPDHKQTEAYENEMLSEQPWTTTVEAVFPDGEVLRAEIMFERPSIWDFETGFNPDIQYAEKEISTEDAFCLFLDDVSLEGKAGAIKSDMTLSITTLRTIDFPRLNPGMVNVTAGSDGYRFLPHGAHFDDAVNLRMAYDTNKIPKGHSVKEIRSFYYDENQRYWVALPRDSVSVAGGVVCSKTTHFTDIINAIVKVPEMPETKEFTPTSIKELQAADPSSGIQMIQPPTANSQGTANVSYPINVPAGRQGLQPNLSVNYSSEGGNGLLGMGWDMQQSSITVDTRWGVPRYDNGYETETYLKDGEELLPSARLDGFVSRCTTCNEKQFYPRIEGAFDSIVRYGTSPDNYFWVVTNKMGIKSYYGTYNGSSLSNNVLRKESNESIAQWPICKVEDLNGNFIMYHYSVRKQYDTTIYDKNADPVIVYLGKQLWLDSITYTGYGSDNGAYKVAFYSDDFPICSQQQGESVVSTTEEIIENQVTNDTNIVDSVNNVTGNNLDSGSLKTSGTNGGGVILLSGGMDSVLVRFAFIHGYDTSDIFYSSYRMLVYDSANNTRLHVLFSNPAGYYSMNAIINKWYFINALYHGDSSYMSVLYRFRVFDTLSNPRVIQIMPYYQSKSIITRNDPNDLVIFMPEQMVRMRFANYYLDTTDKEPNQKMSLYGYDSNNNLVLLNTFFTDINGLYDTLLIPDRTYRLIRFKNNNSPCSDSVELDFRVVWNEYDYIYDTIILSYISNPYGIVTRLYNDTNTGAIYMPLYSTPTSGTYNVELYCMLFDETRLSVPFELSANGVPIDTFVTTTTYNNIEMPLSYSTIYNLRQLEYIPSYQDPTVDELAEMDIRVDFQCPTVVLTISNTTNGGHVIRRVYNGQIEITYTPPPQEYSIHMTSLQGNPISGVLFNLYDQTEMTTPINTFVTDNNGWINGISLPVYKSYYFKQMTTPLGYYMEENSYASFTVNMNRSISNLSSSNNVNVDTINNVITVTNRTIVLPNDTDYSYVKVRVLANGEAIPEYPFVLIDSITGKVKRIYITQKDGYTEVMPLKRGTTYWLKEINIKTGDLLNAMNTISMRIKANSTQLYTMQAPTGTTIAQGADNSQWIISIPKPYRTVLFKVYKTASNRITPLENVHFELCMQDSAICDTLVTNSSGYSDSWTQLLGYITPYTKYVLTETQTNPGYRIHPTPFYFHVDNAFNLIMTPHPSCFNSLAGAYNVILSIKNEKIKSDLRVRKIDEDSGQPLATAGFKMFQYPDTILVPKYILYTDSMGFTNSMRVIANQKYRIIEYDVPDGYSARRRAFVDFEVDNIGNITIIDSCQLYGIYHNINGEWEFTFTNKIQDLIDGGTRPYTYWGDCDSTYPFDKTINARYGFKQSSKEKLRKIIIYYKDECVRSYSFCYGTDAFGRAQLHEIEQWGPDYVSEAYKHKLEYYDDVRPYGPEGEYVYYEPEVTLNSLPEDIKGLKLDNAKWNNKHTKKLLGAFSEPTMLGGTRNLSIGGGGGADVGIGFNAFFKTLSIAYSGSGNGSWSKGLLTLLDINGDGLPDKVYNRGDTVYYRQQLPSGGFDNTETCIYGITRFLKEKSTGFSHGPQISFGIYGGLQWNKNTSTTSVFLTDIDGDGFIDVVDNNKIKPIDRNFHLPTPTFDDCVLPIFDIGVDTLMAVCLGEPDNIVDIPIEEMDSAENILRYDVVRVWKANLGYDEGVYYQLFAPVYLEEDTDRVDDFYGEEDSVIVSIEYFGYVLKNGNPSFYNKILWIDTIGSNDNTIHCESSSWRRFGTGYADTSLIKTGIEDPIRSFDSIPMYKGGMLFFRTQALRNGVKKKVVWDPQVFNNISLSTSVTNVDANGLLIGSSEKASRSQLRQGDSLFICPFEGLLHIEYNQILPNLSDQVRYSIYRNGTRIITHLIQSGSNNLSYNGSIYVTQEDTLSFMVESSTNVDWVSAQWNPYVYYSSLKVANNLQGTSFITIQDTIEFYPTPYYTHYSDIVRFDKQKYAFSFPTSEINITPVIELKQCEEISENICVVIKQNGEILYKYNDFYNFFNRNKILIGFTQSLNISPNDTLYFECYLDNRNQIDIINNCYILVDTMPCPCVIYAPTERHFVFGDMYNGWGQFLYKSDRLAKMDINKFLWLNNQLKSKDFQLHNIMDTNCRYTSKDDLIKASGDEDDDRIKQMDVIFSALPMFADNENLGHKGLFENTSIRGADIRLGRLPYYEDEEVEDPLCDEGSAAKETESEESEAKTLSSLNTMENAKSSVSVGKLNKVSKSSGRSYSWGVSIGFIGYGETGSSGSTYLLNDMMDLNGDGIPDVIKSGYVQYSLPYGGWGSQTTYKVFPEETYNLSTTTLEGKSCSGNFSKYAKAAVNSGKGKSQVVKAGTSFGLGKTTSTNVTDFTMIDMNGDDLPDRIHNSGEVQLNYGYSFEKTEEWSDYLKDIGKRTNVSNDASLGGSFNVGETAIGGGINITAGDNESMITLADVNGDGLPDLIQNKNNSISVRFNNGSGFDLALIPWYDHITEKIWSESYTAGIDGSGTLGWTFWGILKVSATLHLNASRTMSLEKLQLLDMNADGVADILISDAENELRVRYSNIKRSGLLKAVTNPLGGRFEIAYHKTEATPYYSRRWVMDTVKVFDGLAGDGADWEMTTYRYDTGYYDRKEKTFYGFAKVTETQYDENNNAYRRIVRYYNNNNFYTKGLIIAKSVQDADGVVYTLTKNEYDLQTPLFGSSSPHASSLFPAMVRTMICYYEGQPNSQINQVKTYKYGAYGNVILQTHSSTSMNTVVDSITYHPQQNGNYCVSIPQKVEIPNYRKRTTLIDNKGRFTDIKDYYKANDYLTTHMEYDNYGNCIRIVYPNHSYSYTYDAEVHSYPLSVRDTFTHTSYAQDYDFRFGVPLTIIDKYGSRMEYTLDNWGRVLTIRGPKEIAASAPYTIRYQYNRAMLDSINDTIIQPISAFTFNYDPEYPGNEIEVFTYSDGLGRIVQTKKDADVNGVEQKVISGKLIYDAFGRAVENYYPTIQALGDTTYFRGVDAVDPSTTDYDILDRPLRQEAPDGTFQTFDYDFEQDARGYTLFSSTLIDKNGQASIVLKDVEGLQWAIKPAGEPYIYSYYDIMGQCDSVYSSQTNDFCRKYTYDMLGRKTSYTEGFLLENYTYTGTNLALKNIHWYNSITGGMNDKSIEYVYTHDRLSSVWSTEYIPPIEYIYNDQTLQGRLVAIKDESGLQTFEYGTMGEITKSTRVYVFSTQAQPIAFSTEFTYDSWGRMQQIIYPDGEVLDYAYDHGGQLKSMSGIKDGTTYNYLDSMLYNKFGAKTYMGYGNQMITEYSYNPDNLRIMSVDARLQNNPYFTLDYQYDDKGNITELTSTYDWLPGEVITQVFTYDSTDQLVTATGNTQNYPIYDNTIEYSNWGKIQQYNIEITDPLTSNQTINNTDYTYPTSNNNRTQTLFGPEHSHTYQPNGNPTDIDIYYDFGINGSLRKKEINDTSEYYLFNAFDCMKAYSYNGERYGYYGYDASGERTYKYDMYSAGSWSNETGGFNVSLQIDKMMLYPNGYLNMNQNGEYTKHYYADALRIASKIGSGFSQNLCDEMDKILNGVDPSYLDERRDRQYEEMMEELTELINGNKIMDINPIPYPDADLCNLSGSEIEDDLFFYHPDHLGSTGMVTDNNASITQGFLYTPFGEIITEYNPGWQTNKIPKYAFNAKELDEENGMYYYSARYYAPPSFISRDVLFEIDPTFSPYTYCGNNPINYIDPTGNYRYDYDKLRKRSKRLADFLNNNMINYVMNNPSIVSALKTYGQFQSDDEIRKAISNGFSGAELSISDDMWYCPGEYDRFNKKINIAGYVVDALNNAKSDEEIAIALLWVIDILLHETVHYGDWQHGDNLDNRECAFIDNKVHLVKGTNTEEGIWLKDKDNPCKGTLFEEEVYFYKQWGHGSYMQTIKDAKRAYFIIKGRKDENLFPPSW